MLHGDSYSDAYDKAVALARSRRAVFVHPYDDPDVIAGQGTIGMEILRQHPGPIDAIFVAVGGGGLIAGIALVRQAGAAGDQDHRRRADRLGGDDAVAARRPAREARQRRTVRRRRRGQAGGSRDVSHRQALVDEMVLVDTDAICAAIKDVFEDTRSILEPAGALSIAGLKAYVERERVRDKTFVAIATGANMNFDRLRFVAERAELGEQREAIFAVTIPERPGSFREFCALLGKRNITEFNYRYADPKIAHIFVGVEVANRRETETLVRAMHRRRIEAYDLTDNEMAKLHVRHLVGGHAPSAEHEILYRFEFPERPGALMQFLEQHEPRLEHQPVPLSQSRRRLRPGAGRHAGSPRRQSRISGVPQPARLPLRRRIRQPGVSHVPRPLKPPAASTRARFSCPRAAASTVNCTVAMLQMPQFPQVSHFWQGLCSRHLLVSVANFREVSMTTLAAVAAVADFRGSDELPDPATLTGVKVMVIDDSNTIRRSAEIFLLQAGCTVILAEDGFDALAKIADHQPDLIFVDIMMPRLDGYQTCALIKKNAKFHGTPVVMLSSKDGLFDRARGRMVGSDQYLTKPFTKESLLKAVATHVKVAAH